MEILKSILAYFASFGNGLVIAILVIFILFLIRKKISSWFLKSISRSGFLGKHYNTAEEIEARIRTERSTTNNTWLQKIEPWFYADNRHQVLSKVDIVVNYLIIFSILLNVFEAFVFQSDAFQSGIVRYVEQHYVDIAECDKYIKVAEILSEINDYWLQGLNELILIFFVVEYLLRFALRGLSYSKSHYGLVDAVATFPEFVLFLIGQFGIASITINMLFVRVIRFIRLLKLLKSFNYIQRLYLVAFDHIRALIKPLIKLVSIGAVLYGGWLVSRFFFDDVINSLLMTFLNIFNISPPDVSTEYQKLYEIIAQMAAFLYVTVILQLLLSFLTPNLDKILKLRQRYDLQQDYSRHLIIFCGYESSDEVTYLEELVDVMNRHYEGNVYVFWEDDSGEVETKIANTPVMRRKLLDSAFHQEFKTFQAEYFIVLKKAIDERDYKQIVLKMIGPEIVGKKSHALPKIIGVVEGSGKYGIAMVNELNTSTSCKTIPFTEIDLCLQSNIEKINPFTMLLFQNFLIKHEEKNRIEEIFADLKFDTSRSPDASDEKEVKDAAEQDGQKIVKDNVEISTVGNIKILRFKEPLEKSDDIDAEESEDVALLSCLFKLLEADSQVKIICCTKELRLLDFQSSLFERYGNRPLIFPVEQAFALAVFHEMTFDYAIYAWCLPSIVTLRDGKKTKNGEVDDFKHPVLVKGIKDKLHMTSDEKLQPVLAFKKLDNGSLVVKHFDSKDESIDFSKGYEFVIVDTSGQPHDWWLKKEDLKSETKSESESSDNTQ